MLLSQCHARPQISGPDGDFRTRANTGKRHPIITAARAFAYSVILLQFNFDFKQKGMLRLPRQGIKGKVDCTENAAQVHFCVTHRSLARNGE